MSDRNIQRNLPAGFPNRTETTLTYSATTRTVTLSPVGTHFTLLGLVVGHGQGLIILNSNYRLMNYAKKPTLIM